MTQENYSLEQRIESMLTIVQTRILDMRVKLDGLEPRVRQGFLLQDHLDHVSDCASRLDQSLTELATLMELREAGFTTLTQAEREQRNRADEAAEKFG